MSPNTLADRLDGYARDLFHDGSGYGDVGHALREAATALRAPSGWRLVPEMPTKDMLDAYMAALEAPLPDGDKRYPYYRAKAIKRYCAMLAAAPGSSPLPAEPDEARVEIERLKRDNDRLRHELGRAGDQLIAAEPRLLMVHAILGRELGAGGRVARAALAAIREDK